MQQACCVGVKDTTEFKGTFQTLKNGKKFYQTDEKRTRVVVLLTDVFGIKNINNPLVIADKIHENTGLTVIVPDLFDGKEMPDFMEEGFKSQRSTSYWLKAKFNCYAVFCVLGFLLKNSQQESLNILQEHVKNLKEEGVTSVGLLG